MEAPLPTNDRVRLLPRAQIWVCFVCFGVLRCCTHRKWAPRAGEQKRRNLITSDLRGEEHVIRRTRQEEHVHQETMS